MNLLISSQSKTVLQVLNNNGYEAFAVGGCVRDLLRGVIPHDYDVCTNATPEQMIESFRAFRTIPTGIRHGTVTVLVDEIPLEVTTYRIDGDYSDGRRPDGVVFSKKLADDLKRRDFTINAMAYHPDTGLVDLFGGREDLRNKVIRCVGVPNDRFAEDALRMARCIRFEACLGFTVDPETLRSIRLLHQNIRLVSKERIRDEFMKILLSDHAEQGVKAFCTLFGEDVFQETAKLFQISSLLDTLPAEAAMRLAVLLEHLTAPETVLRELRLEGRLIVSVKLMIAAKEKNYPDSVTGARKFCRDFGNHAKECAAFLTAIGGSNQMENLVCDVIKRGDPVSLKQLAVSGEDLIGGGFQQGISIGKALSRLLDAVIADPDKNNKNELIRLAKALDKPR